jgi:hypothetical protein
MLSDVSAKPVDQKGPAVPQFTKLHLDLALGGRIPLEERFKLGAMHREHLAYRRSDLRNQGLSFRAACGSVR